MAQGGRPTPDLLPEARPDAAVAEVGKPLRIDVLANDYGVPPADQPAPEIQVEGVPPCASVGVDGRVLVFKGGADCVGSDVVFGYRVKLGGNWMTAAVSVTVKPAENIAIRPSPSPSPRPSDGGAVACNLADPDIKMTKIEGGSFDKSSVPPSVVDFADLIDENTFSVTPFCITLDAVPAEPVDRYFNNLGEEERREQFPEFGAQGNIPNSGAAGRPAANASQRMAVAFAKRTGERSDREMLLPTLQQYVGAAWELQTKHPDAPETDAFLIAMRNGNLQWTSTPCGSSGSYWTIGPSAQGKLVKLCYALSRLDRTGFRLAIKQ